MKSLNSACLMVAVVLLLPVVRGQEQPAAPARPHFEVASIRPNPGCQNKPPKGGTFTPSPDRMEMPCVNLKSLIQTAYGTFADGVTVNPQPLHMEGGPSWIQSEFYSVYAKASAPPAHPEMMDGPMLQALLEDRFRLETHREMRQMPVYAMTVVKGGLKVQALPEGDCTPIDLLHPAPPPAKPGDLPNVCGVLLVRRSETGNMKIDVRGSTMAQLAQRLSQFVDRAVVDQTSIAGRFNFQLEFTPEAGMAGAHPPDLGAANPASQPPLPDSAPSIFVALQEQLGLKLSAEKGPVSVLIIDHLEKPTAN